MSRPNTPIRLLTILAILALLAPMALPVAAAQFGGSGQGFGSAAGQAASSAQKKSVGTFDVAPSGNANEGKATGAITSAIINDGRAGGSVIKDFTITGGAGSAAAETIFSSIDVKNFEPSSRLSGIGTSALSLKSEGLAISMSDAANSLLTFRATGEEEQQVVFNTAADVVIQASSTVQNVWEVRGKGASGALVLVKASGQEASSGGSSLTLTNQQQAVATLKQGTQLVYRANANYGASAAQAIDAEARQYNEMAVKAVATGKLAGEATSEFSTGLSLIANANFFATAQARTTTDAAKRVTTTLRNEVSAQACAAASGSGSALGSAQGSVPGAAGSGSGSATGSAQANVCAQLLAYDLDYVDLPAATADQVVVYINGGLAQRVDAAQHVFAHADSYWAATVEGRVLVLTNVAAQANAATQVTIAALAQGEMAVDTLAELDAMSQLYAHLEGGYTLLGDLETSASGQGQVIGTFGAFFASEARGAGEVRDFTDIRSAMTIFTKMHFAADVAAQASAEFSSKAKAAAAGHATAAAGSSTGAAATMVTKANGNVVATTEFHDDVYASFITTAEAYTNADLTLSHEISSRFVADAENVLALEGPAGQVGHLVLVRADGTAASASRFDVSVPGHVKAKLAEGDRLVFRSAAQHQSRASADMTASAIAKGTLASEATVGYAANAVTSANVDWSKDVHAGIDRAAEATHKGLVTMEVAADAAASAQATVVALVADRAMLAARTADDIVVKVDGELATAVTSAAQLFASAEAGANAQANAQFAVVQQAGGQAMILVLLPSMVGGMTQTITYESMAEAEARARSALDVFGSFSPGYGGVAQGDLVSLVAKPESGLLLDYAVSARGQVKGALEATGYNTGAIDSTTLVFDAIKVGTQAFGAGSSSTSTSLRFVSDEAIIETFDVSAGTMKIRALQETTAKLDLAKNVEAMRISEQVVLVKAPDFTGAIILTNAASAGAAADAAAQSTLDVVHTANAGWIVASQLAAGAQLVFKAFSGFEAELSDAERQAQANAIAAGTLLGQVIVDTTAGASAMTTTTANINYYEDVKAITSVATADKVEILVDSASAVGKTVIISFDRETVSGLIEGNAVLLVDGKTVKQAASYEDAFVADADKYWLITTAGEVGLQAIVTLSHFSTRTITVETPEGPSVFLWTTLVLGVVVVAQAAYPQLKRRWN